MDNIKAYNIAAYNTAVHHCRLLEVKIDRYKRGDFTGLPIGTTDSQGNDIHFGDTLRFDEKEWGGPLDDFVIAFKDGEVDTPGCYSDLTSFCTIVKKWNE